MYPTNEYGITQYPKADVRRLFVLLAAIDALERPTISSLSDYVGYNVATIDPNVERLREQFDVDIEKKDAVFRIVSWGSILNKKSVRNFIANLD